ncbi:hypothetical protein D3C83_80620 [compost metagenome]
MGGGLTGLVAVGGGATAGAVDTTGASTNTGGGRLANSTQSARVSQALAMRS